ncbi:MarR family winged helix-turn-helix transcriptional regulator [Altericroceibacterium endophyticum]|uniref:MarR family transcriptional regulator n=1 Tax=Altericroceibacterium endophyticum TaxID=1808508 RepID=A0A6I4SZC6_9SPHN|nr:MarR family transcriptional regulator [Altericroceibacterium endophyticum]MXO64147.1 MarR family transcriptional regulator [Altericroceibacterium endophyticum]
MQIDEFQSDHHPFPGSPGPDLQLTMAMVLCVRNWRGILEDHLRPLGQSTARMEALWAIAHMPPESTQADIARAMGIEGATLTRMVQLLVDEELVERFADDVDRRRNHLRLTAKGQETLAKINEITEKLRAELISGFETEQIEQANGFLAQLLSRLRTMGP